jgi:hypothetical protein
MAGPSAVQPPLPPDHERYATQLRRPKPDGTGSFRGAAAHALAHEHPRLLDPPPCPVNCPPRGGCCLQAAPLAARVQRWLLPFAALHLSRPGSMKGRQA